MFKVNNRETRTTSKASFSCLYKFEHIFIVSDVDLEQLNVCWGVL